MSASGDPTPRPREAARCLADPSTGFRLAARILDNPASGTPAAGAGMVSRRRLVLLAALAAEWSSARAVLTLAALYAPAPSPLLIRLPKHPSAPRPRAVAAPDGPTVPRQAANCYLLGVMGAVWAETMLGQLRRDVRTEYAHAALLAGDPRPLLRQFRAETPYETHRGRWGAVL